VTGYAITPPLKHEEAVTSTSFSPNGHFIVTGSFDRTARVWDAKTGEPITPRLRHRSGVRFATFDTSGNQILTLTKDGAWAWSLVSDARPVEQLVLQANILAGRRIDLSGALMPLSAGEIHEGWQRLRAEGSKNLYSNLPTSPFNLGDEATRKFFDTAEFTRRSALRETAAGASFVNLSPFFNLPLTEDMSLAMKGTTLAALPQGRQKFGETEFEVGGGVVQLASQATEIYARHYPTNVSGIKVGRKCQVLHFLYGSRTTDRDQFVAKYVIHFANRQLWEIPVSGQDVNHSRATESEPLKAKRSILARVVANPTATARLLQTSWENPFPDLEIDTIDYVSGMHWGAAFLIAITVE
jgi:hypothetical protein